MWNTSPTSTSQSIKIARWLFKIRGRESLILGVLRGEIEEAEEDEEEEDNEELAEDDEDIEDGEDVDIDIDLDLDDDNDDDEICMSSLVVDIK